MVYQIKMLLNLLQQVLHIFEAVTGKKSPKALSEVAISAQGTLAIATYNTGNIREGFNYIVDATITEGGSLMKAVNFLDKMATPSTFKYEFTLYVPIFTQAAIELSLAETGMRFFRQIFYV